MKRLLDRAFGIAEEINGGHRCPTYMFRWTIAATRWGKLYLHKFVGDDWSLDLHDHPKRFVSIGVWGSYIEDTTWHQGHTPPKGSTFFVRMYDEKTDQPTTYFNRRLFQAPWIRTFPAEHQHRISLCEDRKPCWTLVWVGRPERDWGFWHDGRFMPWLDYVRGKDGIADKMKACD